MAPKRAKGEAPATSSRQSKRIRGQDTEGNEPDPSPSPPSNSNKPKVAPKSKAEPKVKPAPKPKPPPKPKAAPKANKAAASGKASSSAIQIDDSSSPSPPPVNNQINPPSSPIPQIIYPPLKKSKAAAPKPAKKPASSTSKPVKFDATAQNDLDDASSAPPSSSPKAPVQPKAKAKPKSKAKKVESKVVVEKEKKAPVPKKEVKKEKPVGDLTPMEAFDRYKDSEVQDGQEVITMEGFEKLFSDFDISFDGLKPMIFAFLCEQKEMGATLSRTEFSTGFSKLQRTSYTPTQNMKDLPSSLDQVEKALLRDMEIPVEENRLTTHHTNFKNFYQWLFKFVKGTDTSQKVIQAEAATAFWSLTLETRWPVCKAFNKFLLEKAEENDGKGTGVNMDLWTQLHELCQRIGLDGSGYDEMQAWPTLFDEFVEHLRENPASQEV